jgi:signal transduction histidine kinase
MRFRLHIIFLLLVLGPLAAMAVLGYRLMDYQSEREAVRYRESLELRLGEISRTIDNFLQERNRQVLDILWRTGGDPARLREARRENPEIAETFRVERDGTLSHPSKAQNLSVEEWAFLKEAAAILKTGEASASMLSNSMPIQQAAINMPQTFLPKMSRSTQQELQTNILNPELADSGWVVWYYGPGLQILTWTRSESGVVTGAILDRPRMMADLIGRLPNTAASRSLASPSLTALVNTRGEILYQWGNYLPEKTEAASAQIALRAPLQSWALRFYEANAAGTQAGRIRFYSMAALMLSLTGVVVLLALYFIRENTRQLREAALRVSFVNQVSHELKTPLTNIRMYAELLEERLADDAEREQRHARIISEESHRLSRLINNILSFSREQRGQLKVSPAPTVVDAAVEAVVERFRPALESSGFVIETEFNAPDCVMIDRDALEQILCNLISNVEKYAADGAWIGITTGQTADTTTLRVCDRGPGVPPKMREMIFKPFHRLSDRVNEGASGTGIGLSISRELVRLHGGELKVEPTDNDCCFAATLKTPKGETL